MSRADDPIAKAQIPPVGRINLDHVAHFVPDLDTATPAIEQLGFTLTPFTPQVHRLEPGGPLMPAGTGNRCVMLKRGYLEFLTPTADTPLAGQLRTAIERYIGVHVIAFGTASPDQDHARLAEQGFAPLAPIALQREISTPAGEDTARFTVVRVPPAAMPEGRIQYCAHQTPHLVWQARWTAHANHTSALTAVVLCVADPDEAAARYARFTGLAVARRGDARHIDTTRGRLLFCSPALIRPVFGVEPPTLPWIAGYALASADIAATHAHLERAGFFTRSLGGRRFSVALPPGIGGLIIFEPEGSTALELGPHAL